MMNAQNKTSIARKLITSWLLTFLAMGLLARVASADSKEEECEPRPGTPPAKRTGGGSRGEEDLFVSVLAPQKVVGVTTRAQPVLYWYLSKDTQFNIEIVINDRKTGKPVTGFPVTLKGGKRGIQRLDLGKSPGGKIAKLEFGHEYEWVVEAVVGSGEDQQGHSAACRFQTLALSTTLPVGAGPAEWAAVYAREGIWFDYLSLLRAQIEATPEKPDPATTAKLVRLLDHQGLRLKESGDIEESSEKTKSLTH